jgi:hypothetical protein
MRVTPKSANMAQKWMLAFHFLFPKRYFLVLMGVMEDLTPAVFLARPEQVKRINTGDSEIIVWQLGTHPMSLFPNALRMDKYTIIMVFRSLPNCFTFGIVI